MDTWLRFAIAKTYQSSQSQLAPSKGLQIPLLVPSIQPLISSVIFLFFFSFNCENSITYIGKITFLVLFIYFFYFDYLSCQISVLVHLIFFFFYNFSSFFDMALMWYKHYADMCSVTSSLSVKRDSNWQKKIKDVGLRMKFDKIDNQNRKKVNI